MGVDFKPLSGYDLLGNEVEYVADTSEAINSVYYSKPSNILNDIKEGTTYWEIDGIETKVPVGGDFDIIIGAGASYNEAAMYIKNEAANVIKNYTLKHGPSPDNCNIAVIIDANANDATNINYYRLDHYYKNIKLTVKTGDNISLAFYRSE